MEKGKIDKTFMGKLVVVYAVHLDNGKVLYQELPIHPFYKNYLFQVNQDIYFQYAKECTIHYPKSCDCLKLHTYALPIFKKEKTTFKYLLINILKKIFKKNGQQNQR